MKIASATIVFNEEKLIKGCLNTFKPFVDQQIVLISEKPFHNQNKYEKQDRSADIAREEGALVIKGLWDEEHKMRNTAHQMLKAFDYILWNDADMWMLPEDVEKMVSFIEKTQERAYNISQLSYWHDIDHVLINDTFKPLIACRPTESFYSIANLVDARYTTLPDDVVVHHINWCAPKDILKKVLTYGHAKELVDVENWYYNKWINWKDGEVAVMPDGKKFHVKKSSLPKELKKWLN